MKPKKQKTRSGPVDANELDAAALRYLDRFDSSAANLRRVLSGYLKRAGLERGTDAIQAGTALIDGLIARYRESGVLNDARFAETLASGLRRRGSSRRAILERLRARGVTSEVATLAVGEADEAGGGDAELVAARAFARRRRLGPHRPEAERAANRRRDLAALARAGFGFDVARRALGSTGDDDEEW